MKSSPLLAAAVVYAGLFAACVPCFALQTVTLPQNSDGSTQFQDPDSQGQSSLMAGKQGDMKVDGLGSFHFGVSSDTDWPNAPGYYYRPRSSSSAGYGSANVPGSEFYNSGAPFPH